MWKTEKKQGNQSGRSENSLFRERNAEMEKKTSNGEKKRVSFVKNGENTLWKTCGKPQKNSRKRGIFILGKRKNSEKLICGKWRKNGRKKAKSFPQMGVENLGNTEEKTVEIGENMSFPVLTKHGIYGIMKKYDVDH